LAIAELHPRQADYPRRIGVEELFQAYGDAVRLRCRDILHNESDVEDAVQEVFAHVARSPVPIDNPLSYLNRVARNVCNDEFRRRDRQRQAFEAAELDACSGVDDIVDPVEMVASSMDAPSLLQRLSHMERVVVLMRLNDLTDEQIARRLAVSASTVRNWLFRARKKVMAELAHPGRLAILITAALSGLRRRLAGRQTEIAQATSWTALAVPASAAALALLVGIGAPAPGGRPAARASSDAVATRAPDDQSAGQLTPDAPAGPPAAAAAGWTRHQLAGGGLGIPLPAWNPTGPQPTTQNTRMTDVEPSPDYAGDHTVYAVGVSQFCGGLPFCVAVFRSTDGGASWPPESYTSSATTVGPGTNPPELLLPPSAYENGTFYLYDAEGLLETQTRGQGFQPTLAASEYGRSYAGLAPASSGYDVVLSSPSHLIYYKGGRSVDVMPGVFVQQTGSPNGAAAAIGSLLLQPTHSSTGSVAGSTCATYALPCPASLGGSSILGCDQKSNGTCSSYFDSSWNSPIRLSPGDAGKMVLAVSTDGLAILDLTRASGQPRFTEIAPPPGAQVEDAALVGSGTSTRVVLAAGSTGGDRSAGGLYVAGLTGQRLDGSWTKVAQQLGQADYVLVRALATGELIAQRIVPDGWGFSCSRDAGATWVTCGS
jgi:RNA polymerase sigma factor (sigma-70 family)